MVSKTEQINEKVYKDTVQIAKLYPYSESIKINFKNMNTHVPIPITKSRTHIEVINGDCILECIKQRQKHPNDNILLLNLANERCPAGCAVPRGDTQEEHIFRCTNASSTLNMSLYPMDKYELIYTPTLSIIKDDKYKKLEKPITVSMLTIAALNNPSVKNDKYRYDKDFYIMRDKIDAIFTYSNLFESKILILGALGCGVFKNPVEEVYNLFKANIVRYNYCFDSIYFCIFEKEPFLLNKVFTKINS